MRPTKRRSAKSPVNAVVTPAPVAPISALSIRHRLDAVVREAEVEGLLPEAVENLLKAGLDSFTTFARAQRAFVGKEVFASSSRGVELLLAGYLEGASRSAVTDAVAWSTVRLAKLKKGRISLRAAKVGQSAKTHQRHKQEQVTTSRLCGRFAEAAFGVLSEEPSLEPTRGSLCLSDGAQAKENPFPHTN